MSLIRLKCPDCNRRHVNVAYWYLSASLSTTYDGFGGGIIRRRLPGGEGAMNRAWPGFFIQLGWFRLVVGTHNRYQPCGDAWRGRWRSKRIKLPKPSLTRKDEEKMMKRTEKDSDRP